MTPATAGSARGAPWFRDEDDWVLERFAEEPDWPWRLLIVPFNAHFATRPKRVGNKTYQRGDRGKEAMRQRFRLWRGELQTRLNAQAVVGNALEADSSSDEDDEEEEQDIQRLGGILYEAVKGFKRRREDSDDEGPEGDDQQGRGGGDPIAVS